MVDFGPSICPTCQTPTSRTNLARHRLRPVHVAAVSRQGSDPSIRVGGTPPASHDEFVDRFWSYVDRSAGPDGCWPWIRSRQREGYGKIHRGGRLLVASRVALELALDRDLAPDEFACHRCDNPPCCNPAHLFAGTNQENLADLSAKGLMPVGDARPNAKLDEQSVRDIRAIGGSEPLEATGARFGVSGATVRDIVARKKWRHVA